MRWFLESLCSMRKNVKFLILISLSEEKMVSSRKFWNGG